MKVSRFWLVTGAMLVACSLSAVSWAAVAVPGSYQAANGGDSDWDPPNAPVMTDDGGGMNSLDLTGLAGAVAGDRFEFKMLDDEGTPPANWGDPEVGGPGSNFWFLTDSNGDASVTLDRNTYNDGFLPAADRVTSSIDIPMIAGYYATGDWMDEAGAAGDWNPADPLFQMSDQGGGIWSVDATIPGVGMYQFKVTGGNWDQQWGMDGRRVDAANWVFETTVPDQLVTFLVNTDGAISLATIPEPSTCILALGGLLALTAARRRR